MSYGCVLIREYDAFLSRLDNELDTFVQEIETTTPILYRSDVPTHIGNLALALHHASLYRDWEGGYVQSCCKLLKELDINLD